MDATKTTAWTFSGSYIGGGYGASPTTKPMAEIIEADTEEAAVSILAERVGATGTEKRNRISGGHGWVLTYPYESIGTFWILIS